MKELIEQRLKELGYKLGHYDKELDKVLTKKALKQLLNSLNCGSIDVFIRIRRKLYIVNIVDIENEEHEIDICLYDNEEYFSIQGNLENALENENITKEEYKKYKKQS